MDWREALPQQNKKIVVPTSRYITGVNGEPIVLFKETCNDSDIVRNPKYATVNLDSDSDAMPELQPGTLSKLLIRLKTKLAPPKTPV